MYIIYMYIYIIYIYYIYYIYTYIIYIYIYIYIPRYISSNWNIFKYNVTYTVFSIWIQKLQSTQRGAKTTTFVKHVNKSDCSPYLPVEDVGGEVSAAPKPPVFLAAGLFHLKVAVVEVDRGNMRVPLQHHTPPSTDWTQGYLTGTWPTPLK